MVGSGETGEMKSRDPGDTVVRPGMTRAYQQQEQQLAVEVIEWPVAVDAMHAGGCKVIQAPATECKIECNRRAMSLLCN
jgi:hypothetical protein